jgi:hypothetical protein
MEVLRETAVDALRDSHVKAFGCAPEGLHGWIERGAILLVARGRAARVPAPGRSLLASLAELQHAVAAEVYLHTGELLQPAGRSANGERGLLVFAFERVPATSLLAGRETGGRTSALS